MHPYRVIAMDQWKRREVFGFFSTFVNPSVSFTVPLDASRLHQCAKETGQSFFLLSLYAILRASNEVPEMRCRIHGDTVVEFERLAAMTPIMTPDEVFCQIWCEYEPTFGRFAQAALPLVAAGKQGQSNVPDDHGDDFVCASVNPWFHFTGATQAQQHFLQSVPILAWGKMHNGIVPVACKVHHGLMDGLHIGRFFSSVEASFGNPDRLF